MVLRLSVDFSEPSVLEKVRPVSPTLKKGKIAELKPRPTARIIFNGPGGAQMIAASLPESLQQQLKQWVDLQVAEAWSPRSRSRNN